MKWSRTLFIAALVGGLGVTEAMAECNISDAKLEEAILQKPELRDPANRQMVRDLRNLRDSAFILWSYGRHDDCERLLASIRELVSSPSMGTWATTTRMRLSSSLPHESPLFSEAAPH